MWVNEPRTRTNNNKHVVSPEEPNVLREHSGRLALGHLEDTMKEANILFEDKLQRNESTVN